MYIKIWFEEFKCTALSTGSEMIVLNSRSHFNYQIINIVEAAGFFFMILKLELALLLVLLKNYRIMLPVEEDAEFRAAIKLYLKIQMKQ